MIDEDRYRRRRISITNYLIGGIKIRNSLNTHRNQVYMSVKLPTVHLTDFVVQVCGTPDTVRQAASV